MRFLTALYFLDLNILRLIWLDLLQKNTCLNHPSNGLAS